MHINLMIYLRQNSNKPSPYRTIHFLPKCYYWKCEGNSSSIPFGAASRPVTKASSPRHRRPKWLLAMFVPNQHEKVALIRRAPRISIMQGKINSIVVWRGW